MAATGMKFCWSQTRAALVVWILLQETAIEKFIIQIKMHRNPFISIQIRLYRKIFGKTKTIDRNCDQLEKVLISEEKSDDIFQRLCEASPDSAMTKNRRQNDAEEVSQPNSPEVSNPCS